MYHFQPVFSDILVRPSLISVFNASVSPVRSRSGINSAFSRVFFYRFCAPCVGGADRTRQALFISDRLVPHVCRVRLPCVGLAGKDSLWF